MSIIEKTFNKTPYSAAPLQLTELPTPLLEEVQSFLWRPDVVSMQETCKGLNVTKPFLVHWNSTITPQSKFFKIFEQCRMDNSQIMSLRLRGCSGIADFSPLQKNCYALAFLMISRANNPAKVISYIEHSPITSLSITHSSLTNDGITDLYLSPTLTHLNLRDNNITSLAPIWHLSKLNYLDVSDNIALQDITYLEATPNLTCLNIRRTGVIHIKVLETLTHLRHLNLSQTLILGESIAFLPNVPQLTHLNLASTIKMAGEEMDIGPLANCKNLIYLNLEDNNLQDISAVRFLFKLEHLLVGYTHINSLEPLAGHPGLKYLAIDGNRAIKDITSLGSVPTLEHLSMVGTRVKDLSPLQPLINLKTLNFRGTRVANLAPLQFLINLKALNCGATRVTDLAPLKSLINLKTLNCSSTEVTNLDPLEFLINLKNLNFRHTRVPNCSALVESLTEENSKISEFFKKRY